MRPLLIVKTGATLPQLVSELGDFEDWIRSGLGLGRVPVEVCRVDTGEALPPADGVSGVIVTGSPAMVSHRHPWAERTAEWLADVVDRGVPVLGICFGHQLLAHALGAPVGPNPRGREMGTTTLRLFAAALDDPLLCELPAEAEVQTTHVEAVLALPPGTTLLGATDRDPCHAFRVGDRPAWGLQFHPELSAAALRAYVYARRDDLLAEGHEADRIAASICDTPWGVVVLRRFRALVDEIAAGGQLRISA